MAVSKRKAGGGVSVRIDISGVEEIRAALKRVGEGTRKRVIREGMAVGMDLVTKAARDLAPIRSGRLFKAIKTSVRKPKSKWKFIVQTRVGKLGLYKGKTFYGAFQEFGTKFMRPHPFLGPAKDREQLRAAATAREAILQGVENEVIAAAFKKTSLGKLQTRWNRVSRASSKIAKRSQRVVRKTSRVTKRATKTVRKRYRSGSRAVTRQTKSVRRSALRTVKTVRKATVKRVKAVRKATVKQVKVIRKATTKRIRSTTKAATKRQRTTTKAVRRLYKATAKAKTTLQKRVRKILNPGRKRRRR
ncbi:HK97-gp10 family putative phage morphogenesis protein [Paludisphaera rhizosphaerae]|uniref:HK97-gp10 family putative phage morphogenesis protein n=1 Tax=Paludisphaera rhizosphaerae TaxID=2711216 RepID=UPI0013EC1E36|nr:HK97-gp10 family putative phage morphogenesis protein [Paludisphaera rhizosphaerae]